MKHLQQIRAKHPRIEETLTPRAILAWRECLGIIDQLRARMPRSPVADRDWGVRISRLDFELLALLRDHGLAYSTEMEVENDEQG